MERTVMFAGRSSMKWALMEYTRICRLIVFLGLKKILLVVVLKSHLIFECRILCPEK